MLARHWVPLPLQGSVGHPAEARKHIYTHALNGVQRDVRRGVGAWVDPATKYTADHLKAGSRQIKLMT